MYRLIAIAALTLAGCDSSSSSGDLLPHESCEEVEGLAPCCDPPAPSELVCEDGAEVVQEGQSHICRLPGETRIAGGAIGAAENGAVGNYAVEGGGVNTLCHLETGRQLVSFNIAAGGGQCLAGCWSDDGTPAGDDCRRPEPACN